MYLLFDMYLIAGKQLSLEPRGMGDGTSSLPFTVQYLKRKNKTEGQYFDAVVFSYICILKFLIQLNDCMRKVVYLTDEK